METGSTLPKDHGQRRKSYLFFITGCILLGVAWAWGISDNPPAIVSMLLGLLALVLGIIYSLARSNKRKPAYQLLF